MSGPSRVELLGIRHHGPGSARAVVRALDRLAPDVLLVEAPREADKVLGMAAAARPPVALLGYVTDRPSHAAFFPFATFSPEWQAVRWAQEHGVPVRCMDLPLAHTFAIADDQGLGRVDPLGELARAAGYSDAEAWWEDVVEHRGDDAFDAVGDAMRAVRATAPPAEGIEALREATMRESIRAASGTVAVVCGAWHVPALDLEVSTAAADRRLLTGLAKVPVSMTWVPWTHRRLASASGYGAGVASPGWYAHVFGHPDDVSCVRWFANAAALLRAADHQVSPEHVTASARLASAIGVLRGRPRPGLAEVTDAALAVLADGRPGPLALIHDRLVVGDDLGGVPPDTPMVPLARDLAANQKRLRLKPETAERTLELDVRVAAGRGRSVLLHRLWLLGIPWGTPVESRASTGTFRETWRLRWEPELAVRVVEASARGTTLERAATACLLERAPGSVAEVTQSLEGALLADLPDAVAPLLDRLQAGAAGTDDVTVLIDALTPLSRSVRYGDVRGSDVAAMRHVLDGFVVRICAGIAQACTGLDDTAAATMADRLTAVQAALVLLDHPARSGPWPDSLRMLVRGDGRIPGRASRLLLDADLWPAAEVAARLSRALTPGTPAAAGASFVEGFLAGSGTVLLHDRRLLELLDTWLAQLSPDAFADVVPLLRRTFGSFESAERRQLGELVAGRGDGRRPAPFGWDLDPARVDAALDTLGLLLGVEVVR